MNQKQCNHKSGTKAVFSKGHDECCKGCNTRMEQVRLEESEKKNKRLSRAFTEACYKLTCNDEYAGQSVEEVEEEMLRDVDNGIQYGLKVKGGEPKKKNVSSTIVVSAFPGCGKTTLFKEHEETGEFKVLDSDSTTFDKADFPANYIRHIKENIDKVDVIFVSSHKEVREALVKEDIEFILVYPAVERKLEFLNNYKSRGNTEAFVDLLDKHWEEWIADCLNYEGCEHFMLRSGYLETNDLYSFD